MRRFTELLLLVACMLPHPLFVNGLQALRPTIKNSPLRRDATIRGLLVPRELYCPSGFMCQSTFCCNIGDHCCPDGSCCETFFYCVTAPNGVVGCCGNGVDCFNKNEPHPPPPTSVEPLSTANTLPSTVTITTPFGAPTESAGNYIIDIEVTDPHMTWSEHWGSQTSTCNPSGPFLSMTTSTKNASFTYFLQDIDTSFRYYYYYFRVSNFQTEWEVFVNGAPSNLNFYKDFKLNCSYINSSTLSTYTPTTQHEFTQNITVVVRGPDLSQVPNTDFWSLEVSGLLIQFQNSPSGSALPSAISAAGRAQPYGPYRPLLVLGSIMLAAAISILCL